MKVRTAWTASGSATFIMSIISPSPGNVIAFEINSYKKEINATISENNNLFWIKREIIVHTLSKLESHNMLLIPLTNFWFRIKSLFCWKSATKLSISFLANTWPASHLNHTQQEKVKSNQISWNYETNISNFWKAYRLNSSESCASKKNRSLSVRSESRRMGAL